MTVSLRTSWKLLRSIGSLAVSSAFPKANWFQALLPVAYSSMLFMMSVGFLWVGDEMIMRLCVSR